MRALVWLCCSQRSWVIVSMTSVFEHAAILRSSGWYGQLCRAVGKTRIFVPQPMITPRETACRCPHAQGWAMQVHATCNTAYGAP